MLLICILWSRKSGSVKEKKNTGAHFEFNGNSIAVVNILLIDMIRK